MNHRGETLNTLLSTLLLFATLLGGSDRDRNGEAKATMIDPDGNRVGSALLTETPNDGVLIELTVDGLPEGTHALHIHETGACTPDFEAAGDHFSPRGEAHGVMHEGGEHAGDLLNFHVATGDTITVERLAREVTLEEGARASLFDRDGSAIVIHEGPDDYESQPSGDAGARIACGVVEPQR